MENHLKKSDVDPDLARELDAARADQPIEAVLLLRPADSHQPPLDAEALMRRVCQQDDDAEMNYMPRLGVLVVRACSRVIRRLILQPEVEIASANHTGK
jgi:hypothetical protein